MAERFAGGDGERERAGEEVIGEGEEGEVREVAKEGWEGP